MSKERDADQHIEAQLVRYERLIKAATVMTEAEKAELSEWEKKHLTGDGTYGTSNWPGWDAIVNRISH